MSSTSRPDYREFLQTEVRVGPQASRKSPDPWRNETRVDAEAVERIGEQVVRAAVGAAEATMWLPRPSASRSEVSAAWPEAVATARRAFERGDASSRTATVGFEMRE